MFSIPDPSRHRKLCEPIAGEPFSCGTIGCEQLRTVLGRLDRPHQASLSREDTGGGTARDTFGVDENSDCCLVVVLRHDVLLLRTPLQSF